jgi:hypothetical protein
MRGVGNKTRNQRLFHRKGRKGRKGKPKEKKMISSGDKVDTFLKMIPDFSLYFPLRPSRPLR